MTTYSFKRAAPQQIAVMAFIRSQLEAGGEFPSIGAIADHMYWSNASARDCLERLTCKGWIARERVPHTGKYGYRYVYSIKTAA